MRLDQILPERFHGLTREIAKFGTIGIVNVVVNLAVANVLVHTVFKGGEVKANTVAVIVSATSAYLMNRHWTYRDRPKSTLRREYSLFFFFNLIGLVIQDGTVAITKYWLHQSGPLAFNIATGVGIGLGTLFRFWSYRTHVFKIDTDQVDEPAGVAMAAALADVPDPAEPPTQTSAQTPSRTPTGAPAAAAGATRSPAHASRHAPASSPGSSARTPSSPQSPARARHAAADANTAGANTSGANTSGAKLRAPTSGATTTGAAATDADTTDIAPASTSDDATQAQPRLVVTSTADGSVVIKILEETAEVDEIDLDASARANS